MPPKGKRPGAEDAFLFVNEDFSTLFGGAKNTDLGRSKQSHVQRQSFAKRKNRRGSGIASSSTSPIPYEDAQSPTLGGSLGPLTSQSDNQVPLLPFHASNRLWRPAVQDEAQNTTIAEPQGLPTFDGSQLPSWAPSETAFPQQNPYPSEQLGENLSSRFQFDARFTSPPSSALPMSIQQSFEPNNAFSLSPVASTSSDDPFNNVQAALEKWAPPLMRYFTMKMMPDFFYTDLRATSLHNMRHVESLHEDMRSCMGDPTEMYALLAASSSYALRREGKLDLPDLDPEHSNRVILLFKSKAFEALRLRLSRGELSQGMVLAIQRLICTAQHASGLSDMEAHYHAAISMIRSLGGLEKFNDFQKERMIMHDCAYALGKGCPPQLELTWDPGELVPEVNLELVIYMNHQPISPGQRIQSIAENSELAIHPIVAKGISELVETQNVLEWLRERPYRPAEYRWLAHRRLANLHRLLNVDRNSSMGPFEVVRIALLYYCIMVRVIPYSSHVAVDQYVISELKQREAGTMENTFRSHVDMLLWIMVMFGIGMARPLHAITPNKPSVQQPLPQEQGSRRGSGEAGDFDVSAFVAGVGRKACKTLGIREEAQLRDLMRSFLFDDDFVDDRYFAFAVEELCLAR